MKSEKIEELRKLNSKIVYRTEWLDEEVQAGNIILTDDCKRWLEEIQIYSNDLNNELEELEEEALENEAK